MVRASDKLWTETGGYYLRTAEQVKASPVLPRPQHVVDRRVLQLFKTYVNWSAAPEILEVGCGCSAWLAYLGQQKNCTVTGIDIEPYAAQLARANLEGAGARGEVLCRDAFDLEQNTDLIGRFDFIYSWGVMEHFENPSQNAATLRHYLRPGGRILTLVPNLQWLNGVLQRFVDIERYEMHVIYGRDRLRRVHEAAGFRTLAVGHVGFFDAYLTATRPQMLDARRSRLHKRLCWMMGLTNEAWNRSMGKVFAPETRWLSPHIFYVGETTGTATA
jgi:SAM-dependent methyltransferase